MAEREIGGCEPGQPEGHGELSQHDGEERELAPRAHPLIPARKSLALALEQVRDREDQEPSSDQAGRAGKGRPEEIEVTADQVDRDERDAEVDEPWLVVDVAGVDRAEHDGREEEVEEQRVDGAAPTHEHRDEQAADRDCERRRLEEGRSTAGRCERGGARECETGQKPETHLQTGAGHLTRVPELVGRLDEGEDEEPGESEQQPEPSSGRRECVDREPVRREPLARGGAEAVERAAVEDRDDRHGGPAVPGVLDRGSELEADPTREDQERRPRDRVRADDERGRDGAERPDQERERIVRLDVVHLPDEEERGAEEDHAEEIERFPDSRRPVGSLTELVGAGVRGRDRAGEEREPHAVGELLPVRSEETDHAEADGDRADHGERRDGAVPRLLAAATPAFAYRLAKRGGLLRRDEPLRDPRLALAG